MRISWLEPEVIRTTRERLLARHADWAAHFLPEFTPPPAPAGIDARHWPRIAEHVARAERVSQHVRERGLDAAIKCFGDSPHAIELATLIAASVQVDEPAQELLSALLSCDIDELLAYGPFLDLVQKLGKQQREQAVHAYERFCRSFEQKASDQPMWHDRVSAVRDGLAAFYVSCGRHEQGDEIFARRHEEETQSLLVALTASRVFWSAGVLSRALVWLDAGVERAERLGRPDMATRLRLKQEALRKRQS